METVKNFKTTEKDFKLFRKECEKWLNFFGLTDWSVYYEHASHDGSGRDAYTEHTSGDKTATIGLYVDWLDLKPTDNILRQTAFHEVCEILLSEIAQMCMDRYIREQDIHTATHSIIHRLENSVFKRTVSK